MGDLNFDYKLDESMHTNPVFLLENLFDLKQIVQTPTRVTHTSSTLIDVILTSCPLKHSLTGVHNSTLSDHYFVFTTLNISHQQRKDR